MCWLKGWESEGKLEAENSGGRPKWCGRSARKVEAKKKGMLEKFEGGKKVWGAEEVGRPK